MSKMEFSYDRNVQSGKQRLVHVLDDLRSDILTDDDVAKAFIEINYSDKDFDELINLLNAAKGKFDKLVWVNKGAISKILEISEKTFERFKDGLVQNNFPQVGQMIKNTHYKEIDLKTTYYHARNVPSLYRAYVDQVSWQKAIGLTPPPKSTKQKK